MVLSTITIINCIKPIQRPLNKGLNKGFNKGLKKGHITRLYDTVFYILVCHYVKQILKGITTRSYYNKVLLQRLRVRLRLLLIIVP